MDWELRRRSHPRAAWFLLALASACGTAEQAPVASAERKPILITDRSRVPAAVDELVTLEGTFEFTKQPNVLGVSVSGEPAFARRRVRATGILRRTIVAAQPPAERHEWVARRGPGTYYSLVDPKTKSLAVVVPVD
jgi:hypothetical protein